jgi:SAM-dependent methyltransferase
MSDNPETGYVLDTPYLFEFQEELSPVRLNYVATLGGYAPVPLDRPFRYLDIGCGYGVTLAVLAAAFPEASFTGIDLNAEHIREAAALASDAANLQLHACGFGDAPLAPDAQFDFIVMHGLLSWLDDGPFEELTGFLDRHLAPGGIVYGSYNALPGWAATQGLRNMLCMEAERREGSAGERAMAAVEALQHMKAADIAFFRAYPELGRHLDKLAKMDSRYIAHEFLNAANRAFTGGDIARRFEAAGLVFTGSATLFQNYVDLSFPEALQPRARACRSRREIEDLRDFIRNETFRKDVFIRADGQMAADDWTTALRSFPAGSIVPANAVEQEVAFGDIGITYDGEVFEPVMAHLQSNASSPSDLAAALPEIGEDLAADAIAFLIAGAQFQPFLTATKPVALPERIRICHDTTRRLIDRLAISEGEAPVVAPALGSGLRLGGSTAMMLRALDAAPDKPVDWMMARMEETGTRLAGQGKDAFGDALARSTLEDGLVTFRESWLPKLLELGVCEPA